MIYRVLSRLSYNGRILAIGSESDLAELSENQIERLLREKVIEVIPLAVPNPMPEPEVEKATRTTIPVARPNNFKRKKN